VSRAPLVQRIAEWLIRAACRRLPADVRAERRREWAAELPAILDDQSIRPPLLRALRALSFCVGISRTTRQLSRSARAGARRTRNSRWRTGALPNQSPTIAVRAVIGFLSWLVIVLGAIALVRARPDPQGWPLILLLALAAGFDAFCLVDIARAAQVRYLPKWAWAIICLAQSPGGGILYLSIGHVGRARPAPPGEAKP
jgi:Phospholipase_D-nuclease N-terminal